jgi:hypothetical protein
VTPPRVHVSEPFRAGIQSSGGLLTARQVADLLAVDASFVYRRPLELGLIKVGGANRYRAERVEAFVAAGDVHTPPGPPVTSAYGKQGSPHQGRRRVALLTPATGLRPTIEEES